MDAKTEILIAEFARRSPVRFPNESAEYCAARTKLLAEEIELRRHLERVSAQRRTLPPGGEVHGDYHFRGEQGPSDFGGLFGDQQTLAIYSFMYGQNATAPVPCAPPCSAPGTAMRAIGQRVSLAVVARSPIERLVAFKRERGRQVLRLYSELNDAYSRAYFGLLGATSIPVQTYRTWADVRFEPAKRTRGICS